MLPHSTFDNSKSSALSKTSTNAMQIRKNTQSPQLPEIGKPSISYDPQHQQVFNANHISNRLIPEVKRSFKGYGRNSAISVSSAKSSDIGSLKHQTIYQEQKISS